MIVPNAHCFQTKSHSVPCVIWVTHTQKDRETHVMYSYKYTYTTTDMHLKFKRNENVGKFAGIVQMRR